MKSTWIKFILLKLETNHSLQLQKKPLVSSKLTEIRTRSSLNSILDFHFPTIPEKTPKSLEIPKFVTRSSLHSIFDLMFSPQHLI